MSTLCRLTVIALVSLAGHPGLLYPVMPSQSKIVIPKDAGTDRQIADIPVFDEGEWKRHRIWGEVTEDAPRQLIIEIDRYCYGGKLGNVSILKRYLLYESKGNDVSDLDFRVAPLAIRPHPKKKGYQIEFSVTPEPITKPITGGTKVVWSKRGLVEQWHYAADGTLTFERVAKVIDTMHDSSFGD